MKEAMVTRAALPGVGWLSGDSKRERELEEREEKRELQFWRVEWLETRCRERKCGGVESRKKCPVEKKVSGVQQERVSKEDLRGEPLSD